MKSNDGLSRLPRASPSSTTIPLKRKHLDDAPSDTIDCICGSPHEDGGLSIACDTCSRWCHAACFHITDDDVPEKWQCFVCCPHNVDRDKAGKPHRSRPRTTNGESSHHTTRARATTRGRRRGLSAATAPHNHPALVEDTPVDIDGPSWQDTYVHITDDIVLHASTRDRLRRQAQHWRGITALCADSPAPTSPVFIPDNPPSLSSGSATTVHRLSQTTAFHPNVAPCIDPSVRSPTYAIRISKSTPSASLITQYKSSIIPSSVYLSDPSNCYAHLSLPKPYVHLFGPPLDVALDSRITGDESRFVRNGCKPNAVLRPMVCGKDKRNGDNGQGLEFGVFALRDLKADEEVVLGWEWDDGSVVHQLPALIKYPDLFPPDQIDRFRHQLIAMLHAVSSTYPSCACGASSKTCAFNRIAEFLDGEEPAPSHRPCANGTHDSSFHTRYPSQHRDFDDNPSPLQEADDLGPLIGTSRGFRTRERVPGSGGMGGVEMAPPREESHAKYPSHTTQERRSKWKGKGREMDGCAGVSSVGRDWKDKGQKADLDGFGGGRDCARPALNGLGLNIPLSRPHSQSPLPHHANAYPTPNPCHSTSPPLSSKAHLPGPGPGFRLHAHPSYPTPRPDTQQPLHGVQVSWTTGHVSSSGAEQALMGISPDGNIPDDTDEISEESMPPRLRKRWMRAAVERHREMYRDRIAREEALHNGDGMSVHTGEKSERGAGAEESREETRKGEDMMDVDGVQEMSREGRSAPPPTPIIESRMQLDSPIQISSSPLSSPPSSLLTSVGDSSISLPRRFEDSSIENQPHRRRRFPPVLLSPPSPSPHMSSSRGDDSPPLRHVQFEESLYSVPDHANTSPPSVPKLVDDSSIEAPAPSARRRFPPVLLSPPSSPPLTTLAPSSRAGSFHTRRSPPPPVSPASYVSHPSPSLSASAHIASPPPVGHDSPRSPSAPVSPRYSGRSGQDSPSSLPPAMSLLASTTPPLSTTRIHSPSLSATSTSPNSHPPSQHESPMPYQSGRDHSLPLTPAEIGRRPSQPLLPPIYTDSNLRSLPSSRPTPVQPPTPSAAFANLSLLSPAFGQSDSFAAQSTFESRPFRGNALSDFLRQAQRPQCSSEERDRLQDGGNLAPDGMDRSTNGEHAWIPLSREQRHRAVSNVQGPETEPQTQSRFSASQKGKGKEVLIDRSENIAEHMKLAHREPSSSATISPSDTSSAAPRESISQNLTDTREALPPLISDSAVSSTDDSMSGLALGPGTRESTPPRWNASPTPPVSLPPPKTKLTLQEFALRKKKQREEAAKREVESSSTTNNTPPSPGPSMDSLVTARLPEGESRSTGAMNYLPLSPQEFKEYAMSMQHPKGASGSTPAAKEANPATNGKDIMPTSAANGALSANFGESSPVATSRDRISRFSLEWAPFMTQRLKPSSSLHVVSKLGMPREPGEINDSPTDVLAPGDDGSPSAKSSLSCANAVPTLPRTSYPVSWPRHNTSSQPSTGYSEPSQPSTSLRDPIKLRYERSPPPAEGSAPRPPPKGPRVMSSYYDRRPAPPSGPRALQRRPLPLHPSERRGDRHDERLPRQQRFSRGRGRGRHPPPPS